VDLLDEAYEDDDGKVRWRAKPGLHPFWRHRRAHRSACAVLVVFQDSLQRG